MPTRNLILWLCLIGVCLAQTSAPPVPPIPVAISAYYRLAGQSSGPYPYKWLIIDPPLTLTVDAAGSPHLGIQFGVSLMSNAPNQSQILLDTSFFAYRAQVSPVPGTCNQGSGAWTADQTSFYFCIPTPDGKSFQWARIPLQTTW